MHPPAHLILQLQPQPQSQPQQASQPVQQPPQLSGVDGVQQHAGAAVEAGAAAASDSQAAAEAGGITAQQQLGGWTRLYYPRNGPQGQHQVRKALVACAHAAIQMSNRVVADGWCMLCADIDFVHCVSIGIAGGTDCCSHSCALATALAGADAARARQHVVSWPRRR